MVVIIHSNKKKIKFNIFKFLLSAFLIFSCVFGTMTVFNKSNTAMSAYEQCETVVVRSGDTLWSIALEIEGGSTDTRVIVKDIINQNKLKSSEVYAGQTLEIPAKYTLK